MIPSQHILYATSIPSQVVQHRTRRPAAEPLDVYPGNARLSLLMKWAQAACMLQGVRVADFKSSFGDGRVLCYLVRERDMPLAYDAEIVDLPFLYNHVTGTYIRYR